MIPYCSDTVSTPSRCILKRHCCYQNYLSLFLCVISYSRDRCRRADAPFLVCEGLGGRGKRGRGAAIRC